MWCLPSPGSNFPMGWCSFFASETTTRSIDPDSGIRAASCSNLTCQRLLRTSTSQRNPLSASRTCSTSQRNPLSTLLSGWKIHPRGCLGRASREKAASRRPPETHPKTCGNLPNTFRNHTENITNTSRNHPEIISNTFRKHTTKNG